MNETILEKLKTLIDKTLDTAIAAGEVGLNPAQSVRVIEAIAGVLITINNIETAQDRKKARGLRVMSENKRGNEN